MILRLAGSDCRNSDKRAIRIPLIEGRDVAIVACHGIGMNAEEKTIADVLAPLGYDSHMIGARRLHNSCSYCTPRLSYLVTQPH